MRLRWLDRALRPFSKVHAGEGLVAVLMFTCVFAVPAQADEPAAAPRPGDESGHVDAIDEDDSAMRWFALFFNEDRTVGVYPTLAYDSTTGVLAGGRFVARDVFGAHEHVAVRAATGGRDREIITGAIHTGERLGRDAGALAIYVHVARDAAGTPRVIGVWRP